VLKASAETTLLDKLFHMEITWLHASNSYLISMHFTPLM